MHKTKDPSGRAKYVVIILIIAVAATYAVHSCRERKIRQEYQNFYSRIKDLNVRYDDVLKEQLPGALADLKYIRSWDISGNIRYSGHRNGTYDQVNMFYKVILLADDRFDTLSDNAQYEYLCELSSRGRTAYWNILEESLPELDEMIKDLKVYSKAHLNCNLIQIHKDEFYIKTSRNTYQYADHVKDYFVINGEDHFTQNYRDRRQKEQRRETPAPTAVPTAGPAPKKGSDSSGKKKQIFNGSDDPYEVEEYNDPEDFWEDHEDEFEDFEDAWDYWEEHQ